MSDIMAWSARTSPKLSNETAKERLSGTVTWLRASAWLRSRDILLSLVGALTSSTQFASPLPRGSAYIVLLPSAERRGYGAIHYTGWPSWLPLYRCLFCSNVMDVPGLDFGCIDKAEWKAISDILWMLHRYFLIRNLKGKSAQWGLFINGFNLTKNFVVVIFHNFWKGSRIHVSLI